MSILGLCLVVIGALICFLAKKILQLKLKREEFSDKEVAMTKLLGFVVAVVGAVVVFITK